MGAANGKGDGSSFNHTKSVSRFLSGQAKNVPIGSGGLSRSNSQPGSSSTGSSGPRFVEDVLVVWLDASLEKPNESTVKSLGQIRRISNILKTFSDLERCAEFISSVQDEKLFLIVSGSLGPPIVARVEGLDQMHSIFIYCGNKANHEQWTKGYKKVRSLHTQIRELCETVKYHIRQYEKSITSISILPPSNSVELNESTEEFIAYQVLKSIMIEIRYDKTSRKEFMNYARQFYLENDFQLNLIDTLDTNYDLHSPIWWYTRHCCLYSMLQRAFLKQDLEIAYKLAFFIRDLHRDIKKSYLQVHNHQHRPILVYRSARMTPAMFANVERNYEGLLAFNDFLLTTLERSMALKFANTIRADPNAIAVIYKIEIDPVTSSIPYISLNNLSYLSDTEGEILFSMNTIFRVLEIEKLNERTYEISLTPVVKKDPQIHTLVEFMQRLTADLPVWYKLSKVFTLTHQYDQVESLYKYLYSQTEEKDREERVFLQHELGYCEELKNNLPAAVTCYKQAIDIGLKAASSARAELTSTYANLASVLQRQGDFKGALAAYHEASKNAKPTDIEIVVNANHVATLHHAQGKHREAQQMLQQSVQTLLRDFPLALSVLASTYHHLGGLFYSLKDYAKAVEYYEKALEVHETFPLKNQAMLASAYFNAATACEGLRDPQKAIQYAEKAVEAARLAFGVNRSETKENLTYLEQLQANNSTTSL